ncbi:MAG: beta-ketoacyl-ACP synthase III [Planctomycetaceae bacterium]
MFTLSPRTNSLLGVQIVATGAYAPETIVTNEYLETHYNFEPGWVEQRTGIQERRHLPPDQATSDMCVEAAKRAIRSGRIKSSDIDLVVVGTFTPDYICPSTACIVQDQLGLDAPAFDVSAACSGFIYALTTAAQYVATGNSKLALVIGADTNSRIVNPTDQRVAPLFGDAAGAVLVSRGDPHQGLICYQMGADGSGGQLLVIPSSGTREPTSIENIQAGRNYLEMDGRGVFKWAVTALTSTIELVLNKTGLTPHDISLCLFHQANIRIINNAVEQLGIPADRVFVNVHKYGNTSAASIPLAMDEAHREGRIKKGDTILLCGFGAGLAWGTALFRW